MNKSQQPHFAGMAQIETGRPHTPRALILAGTPAEPIHRPLDNGVLIDADRADLLTPEELAILATEEPDSPFKTMRDELEHWRIEFDDCPSLHAVLDAIDHMAIGRSFDLKFWLQAWQKIPTVKEG